MFSFVFLILVYIVTILGGNNNSTSDSVLEETTSSPGNGERLPQDATVTTVFVAIMVVAALLLFIVFCWRFYVNLENIKKTNAVNRRPTRSSTINSNRKITISASSPSKDYRDEQFVQVLSRVAKNSSDKRFPIKKSHKKSNEDSTV